MKKKMEITAGCMCKIQLQHRVFDLLLIIGLDFEAQVYKLQVIIPQ